jgi:MFS family permease
MAREAELDDMRLPVKLKLSLVWAALMFFYLYGDYFGLYVPGQLQGMLSGQGPLGPVSQRSLAIVSVLTVLPGLMVFLSIALPPRVSRWVSFAMGLLYAAIVLATLVAFRPWLFYLIYSLIEMALTLLIAWYAWRWPRRAALER